MIRLHLVNPRGGGRGGGGGGEGAGGGGGGLLRANQMSVTVIFNLKEQSRKVLAQESADLHKDR